MFGRANPSRTAFLRPWLAAVLLAGALPARAQTTKPSADPRQSYQAYAMVHQGDVAAGRKLFMDQGKIACTQCHTIDGKGGKAGPDLFAIGDKYGRDELIQSVLYPSAVIAVGYSTTTVRTKDGQLYQGIVKQANEQSLGLMGADGKLVRIATKDIQQQQTNDVSLMPEGLESGLTKPQFADLIEYLTSLKATPSATAQYQGMPETISELQTPVGLEPFIKPEHRFNHPTWFGPVPGLAGGFTVVEHEAGKIWLIRKTRGDETKTLFLDIGPNQRGTRGLLSMIFHLHFQSNHKYYFLRHTPDGNHFAVHLMEAHANDDLTHDSGMPPREIFKIDAVTNVHYGGCLQFAKDGTLFMSMGDSGPQGDPEGHAQNLGLCLGKILHIAVDHPAEGKLYSIPSDNPFNHTPGTRPEIWAYGLREPWRFSFDPLTGDLWAGDVGQDLYEEVDLIRRGGNYGWNVYETFERYSNKYRRPGETYLPPVFAYTRKYGQSVTGGYVYRADPKSSFYGVYIFADYQNGRLFALTAKNGQLDKVRQIGRLPEQAVSFGCDDQGELYAIGYQGMIYRMDLTKTTFK